MQIRLEGEERKLFLFNKSINSGNMVERDNAQWAADTERLLIAGLLNISETSLDYDEETVGIVEQRCIARFGDRVGIQYYRTLIATLPDRRPELFPELPSL